MSRKRKPPPAAASNSLLQMLLGRRSPPLLLFTAAAAVAIFAVAAGARAASQSQKPEPPPAPLRAITELPGKAKTPPPPLNEQTAKTPAQLLVDAIVGPTYDFDEARLRRLVNEAALPDLLSFRQASRGAQTSDEQTIA